MALKIENYKDVKITKIKSWVVYFLYQGRRFFIKASDEEYEHYWTLYERVYVSKDRFSLDLLGNVYTSSDDCGFRLIKLKPNIRGTRDKSTYTHNQIDTRYFVLHLMKLGLVEGSDDLKEVLNQTLHCVEENKSKISVLEKEIMSLREENSKLLEFRL